MNGSDLVSVRMKVSGAGISMHQMTQTTATTDCLLSLQTRLDNLPA